MSVVCGHCLVTLSLTINETLKLVSSLPTLMQESIWWWQCSDRYIISLFPHLHTPSCPFSPSLISLMVSVDLEHHVYLLQLHNPPPPPPPSLISLMVSVDLEHHVYSLYFVNGSFFFLRSFFSVVIGWVQLTAEYETERSTKSIPSSNLTVGTIPPLC